MIAINGDSGVYYIAFQREVIHEEYKSRRIQCRLAA